MHKIQITDAKRKLLSPVVPKEFQHLVPTRLIPEDIMFIISGINFAICSAFRRAIEEEISVKHMYLEYENLITDDRNIIPEMICTRIRAIPIDQSTPLNAKFSLLAINTGYALRDVKISELECVGCKTHPFNGTTTICTLEAGKKLHMKNIIIMQTTGAENGSNVVATNVVAVSLDHRPIDMYSDKWKHLLEKPDEATQQILHELMNGVPKDILKLGKGIDVTEDPLMTYQYPDDDYIEVPSGMADPRRHHVLFCTNGTMPVNDILNSACDIIIDKINRLQNKLESKELEFTLHGDEYQLFILDENETLGNMIMKTALDLFDNITITFKKDPSYQNNVTIRIIADDPNLVIKTTLDSLIVIFKKIYSLTSSLKF